MTSREFLIYLSLLYKGNRREVIAALTEKREIDTTGYEKALKKIKSNVITILDENYPACMKNAPYPPIVLYYYGDISLITNYATNVAIVGSRQCQDFEADEARMIVDTLGKNVTVVSGLAYGIDSIAQRQAMLNGNKVVGVLGFGIDYCYPEENYDLYLEIKEKGLLISEYPNALPPQPDFFLARNRIIAYASRATLVVCAKRVSGTLSTVAAALNANREVFAVPARILDESACNELIKEGAALVTSGKDILYLLGLEQ